MSWSHSRWLSREFHRKKAKQIDAMVERHWREVDKFLDTRTFWQKVLQRSTKWLSSCLRRGRAPVYEYKDGILRKVPLYECRKKASPGTGAGNA
jgi:hypothetical protein